MVQSGNHTKRGSEDIYTEMPYPLFYLLHTSACKVGSCPEAPDTAGVTSLGQKH